MTSVWQVATVLEQCVVPAQYPILTGLVGCSDSGPSHARESPLLEMPCHRPHCGIVCENKKSGMAIRNSLAHQHLLHTHRTSARRRIALQQGATSHLLPCCVDQRITRQPPCAFQLSNLHPQPAGSLGAAAPSASHLVHISGTGRVTHISQGNAFMNASIRGR